MVYGLIGLGVLLGGNTAQAGSGLAVEALPAAAGPIIDDLVAVAGDCPQMPLPRVAAHITVESGWSPVAHNTASGASGLVQFMPGTWINHGPGGGWTGRPPTDHPVFAPAAHLAAAMSLFCDNYDAMQAHLALTGKPVTLLDAVAVCHVAGCGRVTASTSGIPTTADTAATGCGPGCIATVEAYLQHINELALAYTAPRADVPIIGVDGLPPPPLANPDVGGGCTIADPTTHGCITPTTYWMYRQILDAAGGSWPDGIGCWGTRPNPTSDHPTGRACDLTVGRIGAFPNDAERDYGWIYAQWLRTYHTPLHITYIVWDSKIWSTNRDDEGWRPYNPGSSYDVTSPTGGHYDHIHVSVT